MQNNLFLKVKNSFLELEKDFIDPKDTELKDREIKIKREIEELLVKPVFVSIEDMNRFEKKEMKKIKPVKNTWYQWLISYILEPIRKSVHGLKDKIVSPLKSEISNALEEKIVSLFKINTPKETAFERRQKLSKPRKRINKKPIISEEHKEKN